jgi:ATP-dependent DNA ligase
MTHREALRTLRPQIYGTGSPYKIPDPIIEPLWTGIRALGSVDPGGASLVDADGAPVTGMEAIVDALPAALTVDAVVFDGFLTKQPANTGKAIVWSDEMPSMGRMLGIRRNRAVDTVKLKEAALTEQAFAEEDEVSLVVIDLLWLDDTSLLDVPLLERRRLLDSVLIESDLIRLGTFVRPPIEAWAYSWRSQGFTGLTYKGGNSRYLPGQPNPAWLIAGMPRR